MRLSDSNCARLFGQNAHTHTHISSCHRRQSASHGKLATSMAISRPWHTDTEQMPAYLLAYAVRHHCGGRQLHSLTHTHQINHNFCVANFGAGRFSSPLCMHASVSAGALVSCPLQMCCFGRFLLFFLALACYFRLAPYNLARPGQFYFVQHIQLANWSLPNVSNCACPMCLPL